MKKSTRIIFSFIIFLSFFTTKLVFAEEKPSRNQVPYGVSPIYPENQTDKSLSYFSLRMTAGQTENIEIDVVNTSDSDIAVEAKIVGSITNINGVIDYQQESKEHPNDESLKYPFASIAKVNSPISVPAKETRKATVTIAMPPEEFDGVILGGVEFTQIEGEDTQDNSSGGMAIRNKFRYVLPFKLIETDTEVTPDIKLKSVKASQISFRNVIKADLQNPTATIINDLAIESKVTRKGSSEVLFQKKDKDMQMAPNTMFNFPISLGKQPFKAGKYTLYLVATERDGKKWEFKKDFEITQKEADDYNSESAIVLDEATPWWLYISIGVGVVVLLGVIVFFLLKWRKKKKSQQKNSTKQEKKNPKKKSRNSTNVRKKKKKSGEKSDE